MKVASVGIRRAEEKLRELDKVFTAYDFNSDVRLLCEDGSSLYLKNARHYLWEDEDGGRWVLVFTEHMTDFVFPEEDLLEYATIPLHILNHPPVPEYEEPEDTSKHNCRCARCAHTWEGAFTNDLQMCGQCHSEYYQRCTCQKCGAFKGGHTENQPCTKCEE